MAPSNDSTQSAPKAQRTTGSIASQLSIQAATALSSETSSTKRIPPVSAHNPSVLDEATEPADLWERVVREYSISDQVVNDRIAEQLEWFSKRPRHLDTVAERAQKYLYYIVTRTEERGMPGELALLPIVESSLDPFAYSYGKASGIWQFIPSTGVAYGLNQDWWYDGRRDIRASTEAALNYLEKLHDQFDGDWLLALASYNSGAGTVRRAIRKNQKHGLPTDYWSLDLPSETSVYVPRLIALAQLIRNPSMFNVTLQPVSNEPFFTAIDTGGQIDLTRVAALSGLSLEDIYQLNPEYNRWSTHPDKSKDILIPLTHAEQLKQGLNTLPASERITWRRYKISSGDSLISIAKKFHTTTDVIRTVNDLSGNRIYAGKELLIPYAAQSADSYLQKHASLIRSQQNKESQRKIYYKVRSGDSLWQIAREFKVKVEDLQRWNKLRSGQYLRPGQSLVIWSGSGSA